MNKKLFVNKRNILIIGALCVCSLMLPHTMASAQEKPLKSEEIMKLRNYELRLQNMQLQIEIIHREIERLGNERDRYFDELSSNYGLNRNWRIDLDKGIWVPEKAPKAEKPEEEIKSNGEK